MLAYRDEKMKQINNFILEKLHLDKDIEINKTSSEKKYKSKDGMFIGLKSIRNSEDFSFTPGEKVLLMRYTTSGYQAQVRDIFEINKVNKNTISLKSDESFYANMKFDIKGIYVVKNKNKYLGNSTDYWVLYNKELLKDKDIDELLNKGSCSWGFKFIGNNVNKNIDYLKKCIDEL